MSSYLERNRGMLTCSKVKCYMQSKEAFKKIYIDEIDTSILKESKALVNGDMVDKYILTKDKFFEEYAILDGTLKKDLIRQCQLMGIPSEPSDKVEDLKAKLVGNKKVLTMGEAEMVFGIERELKRQPLFDYDGEYETQKEIIVEYKGHKLKGTLDRLGKEIRDLKTTKDLEYKRRQEKTQFEENLTNFDEYQYGLQLARYAMLVFIDKNERKDGIIDAVKASGTFAFEAYFYNKDVLKQIVMNTLFPTLDQMIEDIENNNLKDDVSFGRKELINNRYYPFLDSTIQKEFVPIFPAFI